MKSYILFIILFCACEAPDPPLKKVDGVPPPSTTPNPTKMPETTWNLSGGLSPRRNFITISGNDFFFISNGEDGSRAFSDAGIYKNGKWTHVPLPFTQRFLSAGAYSNLRNEIFIWGGARFVSITKERGERLGDGVLYDIASGKVTPVVKNDLSPTIRDGHCMFFDNIREKYFIWAGENELTYFSDLNSYDPKEKKWEFMHRSADVGGPSQREKPACFHDVKRSRVLVYGGFSSGPLGDLWVLDLKTLSWRDLTPSGGLPVHYNPVVGINDETLLVFSGGISGGYLLDIKNGVFVDIHSSGGLKTPTSDDLKAVHDQRGFILSGLDQDGMAYIWRLVLKYDEHTLSGYRWEKLTSEREQTQVGASNKVIGDHIYSWGGRNLDGKLNEKGIIINTKSRP